MRDPNWEFGSKICSKSLPKSFSLRHVFIHKIVTDISFSSPSAFNKLLHVSTLPFPKRKHCFSFSKFAVLLFLVTKFLPGIWVEHLFSPFSKNTFLTQNRNCLQVVQAFKSSIFHSYFFFLCPFFPFFCFPSLVFCCLCQNKSKSMIGNRSKEFSYLEMMLLRKPEIVLLAINKD